jgi:[acyl-carrier-protein] S-malonyltransferase
VSAVAFLFPGQGMEVPRMGLELARGHGPAGDLLDLASRVTGQDARRLLRRGGGALGRTEVLQPLLTAVSLGALRALSARGVRPDLVAGHSLGELAAWAAAGGISHEDAVSLAATRGRLMARQAALHPGGMAALRCGAEQVPAALERGRRRGALDLAAHNAPDEWVFSGDRPALRALAAAWPARPLQVSGPWHGRAMAGAADELRRAAAELAREQGAARLVCNDSGQEADPRQMPELLAGQLVRPVLWAASLATLVAAGVRDFVTLGPGRVLRGLARKNLGLSVRVHSTEDAAGLDHTAKSVGP